MSGFAELCILNLNHNQTKPPCNFIPGQLFVRPRYNNFSDMSTFTRSIAKIGDAMFFLFKEIGGAPVLPNNQIQNSGSAFPAAVLPLSLLLMILLQNRGVW